MEFLVCWLLSLLWRIFRPANVANPVDATNALTPGLRTEFVGTYRTVYKGVWDRLSQCCGRTGSNKLEEIYAFPETAPYPRRWERGQGVAGGAFKYVQFRVLNHDWGVRVNFHRNDVADDQTGSLMAQARTAGANYATLRERVFFQRLLGTTDLALLPATVNAADGVTKFSATNSAGGDRFGRVGGNIVSGNTTPNAQDIRDLYQAIQRAFAEFLNTKGQPLHNDEVVRGGMVILYGTILNKEIKEAFLQAFPVYTNEALAGHAAMMSNIVLDSGERLVLIRTPRITTKDIYCHLMNVPVKSTFFQEREAFREIPMANWTNSDGARETNQFYLQYFERFGCGEGIPYDWIKGNNTT